MKTLIKTILKSILLLIAFTIYSGDWLFAQSGWWPVFADTNAMFGSGGIYFTSENTGYAVGSKQLGLGELYPRIRKTTNAGISWDTLVTPLQNTGYHIFRYVFFTNANTGFVTSAQNLNPISANGKILKTTNAGSTWSVYTPSVNKHMTCLWFVNQSTGFATGYRTILKTTDAGLSWEEKFVPNLTIYLFGIYFTSVNTGYVVGNSGYILKTTDCGAVWIPLESNYQSHLWGVWFINENTGVAVGAPTNNTGNKILRTTNAGNNWDSVSSHPEGDYDLYSVRFVNTNTGYVTGSNKVLKTSNGGINWYALPLPIPPANDFFAAGTFFTSANTGYIAGGAYQPQWVAYILKTTTGGEPLSIRPVSSEIPEKYSLSQNYPNPFNPVTKITFALPQSGDVRIEVFDLLGREVSTLVNEKLSPGTYEVDFDGTNYPSGVYFYTLTTGDFTDTKKMILMK